MRSGPPCDTEWVLEGSASHTLWGMSVCANDDQPCEVDLWRPDHWAAYNGVWGFD